MSSSMKVIGNYAQLTRAWQLIIRNQVYRTLSFWPSSKAPDWKKAVSEAEKIVGYPTSFMSLRCLLSDELSNVAMQMRKLVGTKHPLLKTARKYFFDGKQNMQTRGLLVLLMSKAAGVLCIDSDHLEDKMVSGIFQSQRSLAEITEMIYTASLIHKGVVNLSDDQVADSSIKDMEFGNKMAVLSGDFLLANASTALAELNNTKVVEIISSAIGDMMEAEFTNVKDENGNNIIPPGGVNLQDWENQTYLAEGSLLAKSCKCAMLLADQCEETQEKAFEFGKQITFARQAREDLQPFLTTLEDNGNNISLLSLPVVLQLQKQPELTQNISQSNIESHQIMKMIQDKEIIKESKDICRKHGQEALNALKYFPKSEARIALENIVRAVIT